MKRILVLQSRTSERGIERERANFTRAAQGAAELTFLSSVDEKLSWTNPDELLREYDGIIFGGSSDFDFHGGRNERDPARLMSMIVLSRAKNIVAHARADGLPILGVCFGHQLIAQMHEGGVSNDTAQSKFGSYGVQLTEAGKSAVLFGSLSESFFAQYAHKDSVTDLPEGATLLATGSACRFSILRYGSSIYTTQYHPESERMGSMERFHETPEASQIIQLWLEKIVRGG